MRDRKKRTIIIGSLCCLLVFMGIGYAVLSQVLNINGTASLAGEWKIRISDISVEEITGNATNIDDKLTFTDTEATFGVNLLKPGDKIKYKVTVVNEGNVDAVLSINSTTPSNKDIKFTNSLVSGEILYGSSSANGTTKLSEKVFYVTAEFSEYATTVTTGEEAEYKIELTYTQYDGNDFYEPPKDVETDNGVFQVSADGTILNYNADLGTSVSIPATIDDIPITTIASDAFKEEITEYIYDWKVIISNGTTPKYVVVLKEELWDEILGLAVEAGFPKENIYMIGDTNIPPLEEGDIEGYYLIENGIQVAPIITDKITKTYKKLKVNSLDLSNATNLETIEAFAFSNASIDTIEEEFDSIPTGLTSLTFGNNNKEIRLEPGVFIGANLDVLKTYTSIYSILNEEVLDKMNNSDSFPVDLVAPFALSTVNKLVIQPTNTQTEIKTGDGSTGAGTYAILKNVNQVFVEDGITGIQRAGFNSSVINSIRLPNSLKFIGDGAFHGTIVDNLTIPASVTNIGSIAFDNFKANNTLTINASVDRISGFDSITAKTLNINSKTAKTIRENSFEKANIETVNINDVITTIEGSFKYSKITTVNIGKGITSIAWDAFSNSGAVININKPSSQALTDFYYAGTVNYVG